MVSRGCLLEEHYEKLTSEKSGLELAKLAGLPESVMAKSTAVAHKLEASRAQSKFAVTQNAFPRMPLSAMTYFYSTRFQ